MAMIIEKPILLLVEGKDEVNFFEALLDECQIKEVQIIEVGGKDKFKLEFPASVGCISEASCTKANQYLLLT